MFKVAGSASRVSAASYRLSGTTSDGQVTSGGFCGTGTPYSLYFVALFTARSVGRELERPAGDGRRRHLMSGAGCGAYVSFDPRRTSRDDEGG